MTATSNFVHLSRPLPATATTGAAAGNMSSNMAQSTTPISVTLTPSALFSIIDHAVRRPAASPRVIGTLLGSRSDDGSVINIASCYAVPHTETAEQVEVDMDYQKAMLNLHLRANPKEVLVGWYATSRELNTFSALIQNFYGNVGEGTGPAPAVHLTVAATDIETTAAPSSGGDAAPAAAAAAEKRTAADIETPEVRAYISAPIGVTPERTADSCLFIPVPCTILSTAPLPANFSSSNNTAASSYAAERSALSAIALAAANPADRTAALSTDIDGLERSVEYILNLIERVSGYVGAVLDEEIDEPSTALGQFMLNALSLAPGTDKVAIERDFNAHIQDVLAISYLANTIRTQIDLSNRLVTAALTTGGAGGSGIGGLDGPDGADAEGGGGAGGTSGGGGRKDRRGGGGATGDRNKRGGGDRRPGGDRRGPRQDNRDREQQQQSSSTTTAAAAAAPAETASVAFSE